MKKTMGTLLLLTIAPVCAVIEGCADTDKNECQVGLPPKFFDVQGLTLSAFHQATGVAIAAGESVAAAEVRLETRLQVNYYGHHPAHSGWLPAAYACPPTPAPGYEGTTERLDSLVVRCVYEYDATHPAGAVINDLLITERVLAKENAM